MSAKPILWGVNLSPPVRAVLLTLNALGLDYEFKEVNLQNAEHKTPDYLKRNPQHTVPTLEDDGKFLWDSHAICAYLVRKYGKDDSLYPKDFYQRAVVDQRLHYENGVLFMTLIKQCLVKLIRGEATLEQMKEQIGTVYEAYDLLENFLGDNSYMATDHLTIADLSIVTTVSSLGLVAPIDAGKHPKLAAWFERIKELPYYEEANGKAIKEAFERMKDKLTPK